MNYIEFIIRDKEAYERLSTVVEKLKQEKAQGTLDPGDESWKTLFGAEALKNFWWPTEEEFDAYQRLYFSTPPDERAAHPGLQPPWDFESLIEAIKNGNYQLTGCTKKETSIARLEFAPFSHPYGGSESLQALVESFGHKIVAVKDAQPL